MNEEQEYSRGDIDPRADLKAQVEAQFAAALEEQMALELTQAPAAVGVRQWEVYAWGPYQLPFDPGVDPGRIIFLGEKAYLGVAVWLNPQMCADLTAFTASRSTSRSPILARWIVTALSRPARKGRC